MITYIILGITYFGLLTLSDRMDDEGVNHKKNLILTVILIGVWYIINTF